MSSRMNPRFRAQSTTIDQWVVRSSIDEHVCAFCKTIPQIDRGDCEAGSSFEASLIDIDPDLSRNGWVASDLAATLPPLSCGNRAYPRPPPEFVVTK